MAEKKGRTLLSASVLMMLAAGVLVGGTYALFTDTAKITNHLQAGNLNISLLRTKLTKKTLDDLGYLKEETDTTIVDFSGVNETNMFGLSEDEVIVPTSSFTADLKLINGKVSADYSTITPSSVAFKYNVKIVVDSSSDADLISQLNVVVKQGDTEVKNQTLDSFDNNVVLEGVMDKEDEFTTFSVQLNFVNLEPSENNKAQDKEATFDLVIEAVQLVDNPTTTSASTSSN